MQALKEIPTVPQTQLPLSCLSKGMFDTLDASKVALPHLDVWERVNFLVGKTTPAFDAKTTYTHKLLYAMKAKGFDLHSAGPTSFKHDGVNLHCHAHYMYEDAAWESAVQWIQKAYASHMEHKQSPYHYLTIV
jgi:hypothetical protein